MARCLNGGGGIIASVVDPLRYMQFHLQRGRAEDGARLLREDTIAQMQSPHADAGSMCERYGLGWMLDDVAGQRLVKHGGATNGFLSSFELFPDLQFGCTVLTNADTGRELRDSVAAFARRTLLRLSDRQWQERPTAGAALQQYAGEYRAILTTSRVDVIGDALQLTATPNLRTDHAHVALVEPPIRLSFYAPDATVVMAGSHRGERCEFLRDADGQIKWLRWDGRLAARQ